MQKRGFTLAEVLISLVLIGVTAALTLPGFLSDMQNRDIRVMVKKAYNTLSQSFDLICVDNDGAEKWATSASSTMTQFSNRFKLIRYDSSTKVALLRDGLAIKYTGALNGESEVSDCSGTATDTGSGDTISDICGTFIVNIKGNNSFDTRAGVETFAFYLTRKGIIPYGGKGTNRTSADLYVTGQVIYDGNFDYLN